MNIASRIIEALGGTTALAGALKIPPSTVQSWKKAEAIPEWRMPALRALAAERGVKLPEPEMEDA